MAYRNIPCGNTYMMSVGRLMNARRRNFFLIYALNVRKLARLIPIVESQCVKLPKKKLV